jgi:hypothetical protein
MKDTNFFYLIKKANNPLCALTFKDILHIYYLKLKIKVWIPIRYFHNLV